MVPAVVTVTLLNFINRYDLRLTKRFKLTMPDGVVSFGQNRCYLDSTRVVLIIGQRYAAQQALDMLKFMRIGLKRVCESHMHDMKPCSLTKAVPMLVQA